MIAAYAERRTSSDHTKKVCHAPSHPSCHPLFVRFFVESYPAMTSRKAKTKSRGGFLYTRPQPIEDDPYNPGTLGKRAHVEMLDQMAQDKPMHFAARIGSCSHDQLSNFCRYKAIPVAYESTAGGRVSKVDLIAHIQAWHRKQTLGREMDESPVLPKPKNKGGRPRKEAAREPDDEVKSDTDADQPDQPDQPDPITELHILVGEIEVGNDSLALRKKLKALTDVLVDAGQLTPEEAQTVLRVQAPT